MDESMDTKCENLMNVVVESRKHFKKMCIDYEQKTTLVENKLLNLQTETLSGYRFKSKHPVPDVDMDLIDSDNFMVEFVERQHQIEDLKVKVKNTQNVVMQLRADNIGRRLREPLTAEALLAQAKEKKVIL